MKLLLIVSGPKVQKADLEIELYRLFNGRSEHGGQRFGVSEKCVI